jgi:hypothetical protein
MYLCTTSLAVGTKLLKTKCSSLLLTDAKARKADIMVKVTMINGTKDNNVTYAKCPAEIVILSSLQRFMKMLKRSLT